MAKDKINQYSATAASNTDVGGVDLGEGTMTVSDINDAMRELMSHLAEFQDGTAGIDVLSFTDDTDTNQIKFQAPSSVTTTTTFTLPDGDGSSGEVLTTNGSGTLSWGAGVPTATVLPYAGSSAPTNFLLCYGQAISRTTYATLFAVVGTTYGVGDGSTTFNLPDLRGRAVAGQDDMGGTSANRMTSPINGDTLGATGGSEGHTLTTAQLPAHDHKLFHSTLTTVTPTVPTSTSAVTYRNQHPYVAGSEIFSYNMHGVSGSASIGASSSVGSGSSHNNVQPTIILNYIIKT